MNNDSPSASRDLTRPENLFWVRDFQFFLLGRFVGTLGMMVQSVAVGWHVYNLTSSPLALGYVGLAQFLPIIMFTLSAGDIADRVDRRLIVALGGAVQAISSLWLIVLTLRGVADVRWFYAALFVFGVARAFAVPASRSFVPLLVAKQQIPRAIAISSSIFQSSAIMGPALGGALYVFGPATTYIASALLFLTMTLSFSLIKTKPVPVIADPGISTLARVMAGVSYIRHSPIVLGAVSLDLFAVLLGGAVALLPIFARDILHVGPEGLGVLRSAPAIGALLLNFLIIARPPQRHTGLLMFGCIALFGITIIIFGLSTNFWLSLGALTIMGSADMVSVYVRSTLVPLATPVAMLGRVTAVEMLFIGASNELGEFESGLTAGWFGTVPAVIIGGIGTLGIVAIWMWLFPDLRKVDKLADVKPVEI